MTMRLGGWKRLGILASMLWAILVVAYALFELKHGPNSAMLLINMIVTKTGEPQSVLAGNSFASLVPVEARLVPSRFAIALLVPPVAIWVLLSLCFWLFKWVATGFKSSGT
jgi:hypothetical protein